jgi:hypothetical protein
MVDINSYFKSLKVSWVKRMLSPKTSNWKVIPRKYLDKFWKNWLIFKMNMDNGKSIENFNDIPEFYKEIINIPDKSVKTRFNFFYIHLWYYTWTG